MSAGPASAGLGGALAGALAVGLGGAAGALLRWGASLLFAPLARGTVLAGYPLPTLAVNVAGCFLLGAVAFAPTEALSLRWRLALGTGFAGALTTFSTFELDAFVLQGERGWIAAAGYVSLNLLLGAAALAGGRALVS